MEQAVPFILTAERLPPPLSGWGRFLAGVIALGALAMLATGAWLTPGTSGVSTHTQLGLAACQFEVRTGVPCPSCGYTTAVTHFAHGNLVASLYLQPMGFVIALLASCCVWIGLYIAATGRPVHRLLGMLPVRRWLLVLLGIAIGGWAWKIFIHLTGRDYWR